MAIPLLAAGMSIAGGILPGIISALAGSKTEAQARAAVAPQYDAMVSQLVGRGMTRTEAQAQADEAITGAVQEKMQEGALPGWAEALLSVAGGIGGWAAGAKLAAKGAGKLAGEAAQAAPKAAAEAVQSAPKGLPFSGGTYRGKAAPDVREPAVDEIIPPFRSAPKAEPTDYMRNSAREVQPMGVRDSAPELLEGGAAPARISRQTQLRLGHEPEVGSPPPAQPMSPHEEFRDFLRRETRSEPSTPPIVLRKPFMLGYDEAADIPRHMRESGIPDMPMGVPGDDAADLAAWAARAEQTARADDLAQLRARMKRY